MDSPRADLPTGTVTFLFSDIEGSTELVQALDPGTYRDLLETHHGLLRATFAEHDGVERGTQGDSFLVVFRDAPSAVAAAVEAQRSLALATWPAGRVVRVRMGLHSGEGIAGGDDYVGVDINRAARIAGAAHGGQVLISDTTRALAGRSLPVGVGLRDLGDHRLKGLEQPERLFQLTIAGQTTEFPPPRAERMSRVHLPARLTSFVGRERELADLRVMLDEDRAITLLGAGGIGKTSLATELARTVSTEFVDGVWFVGLEALADPDLVAPAIVAALGLRDVSGRTARERLLDNLAERDLLLVVDNFEQVTGAAPLLDELLAGAPGLRLVVTSRSPLRIAAERVYTVSPLPVPDGDERTRRPVVEGLDDIASVRLFVERARHRQSSFALTAANSEAVAEICRLLDGLPLGIELAAARIAMLGPVGIRDRLASRLALPGVARVDAPSRQRTLEQAVAWSYDLLDPASRTLFARLAVFAGGWRVEELELVCGDGPTNGDDAPSGDVFETLSVLVDQSLVLTTERAGGVRFDMLETIRRYAADRLGETDDRERLARRHALTYLAVAEAASPMLPGRMQAPVLERLAADRDNLRAAIRWAVDSGEPEIAARLSTALTWFWGLRGDIEEARSTVAEVIGMPGADVPTPWRMRALESAGTSAYYGGSRERAADLYQRQLDLARTLDDPPGVADALFNLAFTQTADSASGYLTMIDQAADIYRALGDARKLARTEWARGVAAAYEGRPDEAGALWQRSFDGSSQAGDTQYASMAASSLAVVTLESGDRAAAAHWFIAGLTIARDVADTTGMILALPIAAVAALGLVGPEPAATIMGAYEGHTRRYGIRPPSGLQVVIERSQPLERARAGLDDATFERAFERGLAMTPEESTAFVLAITDRLGSPGAAGPADPDGPGSGRPSSAGSGS